MCGRGRVCLSVIEIRQAGNVPNRNTADTIDDQIINNFGPGIPIGITFIIVNDIYICYYTICTDIFVVYWYVY